MCILLTQTFAFILFMHVQASRVQAIEAYKALILANSAASFEATMYKH